MLTSIVTEIGPTIGVGKLRVPKSIRSTAVLLASVVALTGVSVTVLAASNASPADLERGGSISFQAGGTGPSFPEGTVIEDQIYETRVTIPDLQLPRATGGSEPLTYTIAPPLPSGLVFDPTNLTITNRSTSDHDETNYTYTVTDGDDATASLTFTIEVEDYEPSVPSFGDQDIENQTYSLGRPITALQLPAVVKREGEDRLSGNGKITYGITTMAPATDLPNGLSFDPGTLQITGTPAETNSPGTTVHTYTASDGDSVTGAADEASITFSITLETDTSPSFGTATIADQEHKFGTAFSGLPLPAATGGNGDIKYEFDPPLPDGLTLAVTEGTPTISGTPTVSATNERDYTYTAKDRDGDSASLTFSIRLINPLDTAHISKIGPAVRSVAVSPGETVVLRTHLYGLQGEVDADLDTDAVAFAWSYAAAGSNDSNAISGNDAAVPFTVPSSPGTYTAKATLIADHCTSTTPNEWKASDCTAEFEVVVKRPSASAAEDEAPVNPPASAIPSILTDSDGNQYEVFTPEQGGTFAGEGYWVQAHPGAVPNGEVIGIRMAVGGPADNSEMTAHRYTLGGSTYGDCGGRCRRCQRQWVRARAERLGGLRTAARPPARQRRRRQRRGTCRRLVGDPDVDGADKR